MNNKEALAIAIAALQEKGIALGDGPARNEIMQAQIRLEDMRDEATE